MALLGSAIFSIILGLFILWIYFLPTFIASKRNNHFSSVLLINLFFGWSLVGWIIALAIALSSPKIIVVEKNEDRS